MKLVIASDIHGSAQWCEKLLNVYAAEKGDRLLLLGDILYHGPRNDVPADYAPKNVAAMLNELAAHIICVRGNCEAEVDQMVLSFPCMSEANALIDPETGATIFATHGHIWGPGYHNSVRRIPELPAGSALVYGHTHIKVNELIEGYDSLRAFNPGSVGLPKDGTHSCGIYENGVFRHVILG